MGGEGRVKDTQVQCHVQNSAVQALHTCIHAFVANTSGQFRLVWCTQFMGIVHNYTHTNVSVVYSVSENKGRCTVYRQT